MGLGPALVLPGVCWATVLLNSTQSDQFRTKGPVNDQLMAETSMFPFSDDVKRALTVGPSKRASWIRPPRICHSFVFGLFFLFFFSRRYLFRNKMKSLGAASFY